MLKLLLVTAAIILPVPSDAAEPKGDTSTVKPAMPPPPPPYKAPVPTGTIAIKPASGMPKGWIECEKTNAKKYCDKRQQQHDINAGKQEPVEWIVRLPESGKVEDLNAFLKAAEDSLSEQNPQ